MPAQPVSLLSAEAYLALERESEIRHEFYHGEIFAMSGASRRHNLVAGNIFAQLLAKLRGSGCEVYINDMRVQLSPHDIYVYPDVVATCEPRFADDEFDTLVNPLLVVEVLSKSTEDYDRGKKFALYRQIPTLMHYLVVEQERLHVELFSRQADGQWLLYETDDPAASLHFPALPCTLSLEEIYEAVPMEKA